MVNYARKRLVTSNHMPGGRRPHSDTREGRTVEMPLTMARTGEKTTVRGIHGKEETRRFLESLGVVEGGKVTIVSEMGGNLIVNVKDTRIALSKAMASKIMV